MEKLLEAVKLAHIEAQAKIDKLLTPEITAQLSETEKESIRNAQQEMLDKIAELNNNLKNMSNGV